MGPNRDSDERDCGEGKGRSIGLELTPGRPRSHTYKELWGTAVADQTCRAVTEVKTAFAPSLRRREARCSRLGDGKRVPQDHYASTAR